ncbi:MAG: alpha/beta hydrolase-fold protein [Rhodothermaceae bacterium]
MKKTSMLILVLFCSILFAQENSTSVELGTHFSFKSKVLNEERSVSIFLPASYHLNKEARYPVVYMVDGDYNFFHLAGLTEQLSSISERIPEMIVVAISDKGHKNYLKNMTPTDLNNPKGEKSGRANKLIEFLEKDLKPLIANKYRTAPFDILMGHSVGGLFAVTVLTEKPELFNAYVAISPSIWWNETYLVERAENVFEKKLKYNNQLIVTLGNEQGMKVEEYLALLEKFSPEGLTHIYKHFPDESHNSVGLKSMEFAFYEIFKNWEFNSVTFAPTQIRTYVDSYNKFSEKLGYKVTLPPTFVFYSAYSLAQADAQNELDQFRSAIVNFFPSSLQDYYFKLGDVYRRLGKLKKAEKTLLEGLKKYPESMNIKHTLGLVYEGKNEILSSRKYLNDALNLGKKLKVRRWMMNFLEADFERVYK